MRTQKERKKSNLVWDSVYKKYPEVLQRIPETENKGLLSKKAQENISKYVGTRGKYSLVESEKRRVELQQQREANSRTNQSNPVWKQANFVARKIQQFKKETEIL